MRRQGRGFPGRGEGGYSGYSSILLDTLWTMDTREGYYWLQVFHSADVARRGLREGYRIRREQCAEKNVRDFEPEYGTVMRRSATFAGLYALEVLPARISVFFHAFKSLKMPKLTRGLNAWCDLLKMPSLKTKELSSTRDVIRSVCR